MERQYRPIEPKKAPGLKKAILVILTPIEKVCDFMVKRPWTSLFIIFGSILGIGYMGYIKVAFGMAVSVFITFIIMSRIQGEYIPPVPDISNYGMRDIFPGNIYHNDDD
ncbi:MAG: hypothetical protein HZB80_04085 [Deltaproteobacteria bacterium]|nr:hypothetical protein [Deltaproteobacteria bacterium]